MPRRLALALERVGTVLPISREGGGDKPPVVITTSQTALGNRVSDTDHVIGNNQLALGRP